MIAATQIPDWKPGDILWQRLSPAQVGIMVELELQRGTKVATVDMDPVSKKYVVLQFRELTIDYSAQGWQPSRYPVDLLIEKMTEVLALGFLVLGMRRKFPVGLEVHGDLACMHDQLGDVIGNLRGITHHLGSDERAVAEVIEYQFLSYEDIRKKMGPPATVQSIARAMRKLLDIGAVEASNDEIPTFMIKPHFRGTL
jgi:hypothetical protein